MIFINYRVSDSIETVRPLDADLTREFGDGVVFRDKSNLEGGDDWPLELEQKAKNCDVMLVVIIGATWQAAADCEETGWARHPPGAWSVRKMLNIPLRLA